MVPDEAPQYRAALLHGAGYTGRELIRLLALHPYVGLVEVTSRSHAAESIGNAHPALRGVVDLEFSDEWTTTDADVVLIAAEHGRGVAAVERVLDAGYEGAIIDLSADFRLRSPEQYEQTYGSAHPAPALLPAFQYGLPEVHAPYDSGTKFIANPGCFATGLALALHPLSLHLDRFSAAVTGLTGASGSGARPKSTTHFPDRDGNLRAYSVLNHRHLPEVQQLLGPGAHVAFTPVSGPWTRGIWGTASVHLGKVAAPSDVEAWFQEAYGASRLIRLSPGVLPELLPVVGSPFCDIGWVIHGRDLVIGFALDNLMKGAASQAIQNLNLLLGLPETAGLLPDIRTDLAAVRAPHA